tara:strand:- start:98 stop:901 length:804 start_codon:yes stop_codon:yes gene_type:complete
MATNNLSVSGTANWIGAALGTTYRAITMLLVRAGTDARMHFRTGLSLAGGSNSGYGLQCVDDDNASPSTVDLWLYYRNLYFKGDVRFGNGFNLQTTADDISFAEGTSGDVLTSGGTGASMSWTAPYKGCRIYNDAVQAHTGGATTTLAWDQETFDVGGPYHDNSTNNSRITIPAGGAGKYLMHAQIQLEATVSGDMRVLFYKNGNQVGNTGHEATWYVKNRLDIMDLAAADYIEVKIQGATTSSIDFDSAANGGIEAVSFFECIKLS